MGIAALLRGKRQPIDRFICAWAGCDDPAFLCSLKVTLQVVVNVPTGGDSWAIAMSVEGQRKVKVVTTDADLVTPSEMRIIRAFKLSL